MDSATLLGRLTIEQPEKLREAHRLTVERSPKTEEQILATLERIIGSAPASLVRAVVAADPEAQPD